MYIAQFSVLCLLFPQDGNCPLQLYLDTVHHGADSSLAAYFFLTRTSWYCQDYGYCSCSGQLPSCGNKRQSTENWAIYIITLNNLRDHRMFNPHTTINAHLLYQSFQHEQSRSLFICISEISMCTCPLIHVWQHSMGTLCAYCDVTWHIQHVKPSKCLFHM